MALGDRTGANPFLIYAQIPPRARYQFLLDHAEYILRTFIRGPVCKGQIALNVIHDHFWVMFLDPDSDQTLAHPDFLVEQAENLRLPTEEGSSARIVKTFSNVYRDRYVRFYRAKSELYDETDPDGLGLEAIWKGERGRDTPVLTIYRHFDSASVHKGVLGGLPRTLWVIDYSQFERIYYALVAGFDVFGNLSHQVNIRRYMDYLRVEAELNFVEFLPPEIRIPTLRSWYIGAGAFEDTKHDEVLTERGTKVRYTTDDPKREFIERVVDEHILKSTGIKFDSINYRRGGSALPAMPTSFKTHEDIRNGFRALTAPGTGFIRHVNGSGANVLYVRVRDFEGSDRFFSIVINRWHDNVNSMFGEQKRLDSSKDTIDFIPGSIGSYPNYFLVVDAQDVPDLIDMLENFDGSEEYVAKLDKYGVNRAEERFWDAYDWFQQRLNEADPLHAGLYDLNRYYSRAVSDSD
ncbi:MAG: fatty acid cis/trans isomerase [Myxococcales bacterium]|nr:fatty acid cis/trans isomerase [Myxococcales bacterium]